MKSKNQDFANRISLDNAINQTMEIAEFLNHSVTFTYNKIKIVCHSNSNPASILCDYDVKQRILNN